MAYLAIAVDCGVWYNYRGYTSWISIRELVRFDWSVWAAVQLGLRLSFPCIFILCGRSQLHTVQYCPTHYLVFAVM